jgi:DNA-binding CsgD family transcriptional regulator
VAASSGQQGQSQGPQGRSLAIKKGRSPIAYGFVALLCCVAPRALGRSVLLPLLDAHNNTAVFLSIITGMTLLAILVLLSANFSAIAQAFLRPPLQGGIGAQAELAGQAGGREAPSDDEGARGEFGGGAGLGELSFVVDAAPSGSACPPAASSLSIANNDGSPPLGGREGAAEDLNAKREEIMRQSLSRLRRSYGLSMRETEVLTLYALGHTQKKVAEELFISYETVHSHIKNVYIKTGLSSRQEILDYIKKP